MPGLSAGITEILGRLVEATGLVKRELGLPLTDHAGALRLGATHMLREDAELGRRIGAAFAHAGTPAGRHERTYTGTDDHGKPVTFRASQVRSQAMIGPRGDVIGVTYPTPLHTQRYGEGGIARWAQSDNRVADFQMVPMPVGRKMDITRDRLLIAPWHNPLAPARPVYLDAESNGHTVVIDVNVGTVDAPRFRTVDVDGGTFGRVAASSEHLARALEARPDARVAATPCLAAMPGGSVARMAASALHNAGLQGTVHAATGKVRLLHDPDSGISALGIDITPGPDGARLPLTEKFSPPEDVPYVGKHRSPS